MDFLGNQRRAASFSSHKPSLWSAKVISKEREWKRRVWYQSNYLGRSHTGRKIQFLIGFHFIKRFHNTRGGASFSPFNLLSRSLCALLNKSSIFPFSAHIHDALSTSAGGWGSWAPLPYLRRENFNKSAILLIVKCVKNNLANLFSINTSGC